LPNQRDTLARQVSATRCTAEQADDRDEGSGSALTGGARQRRTLEARVSRRAALNSVGIGLGLFAGCSDDGTGAEAGAGSIRRLHTRERRRGRDLVLQHRCGRRLRRARPARHEL
jgi:hypothetical protein